MVRSIIISLIFCMSLYSQTTNRIVYEGWLDSLVTQSPFSDSVLSLIVPADSFYTEDLRIPVSSIRLAGSNDPAPTAYQGGEVLAFSAVADNSVFFDIQMAHAREADSDIQIHLHFALEDNGTNPDSVRWVLTYTWANINGAVSAPTTVNYTDYVSTQTDSTHYYEVIATISGTGKTASSMLLCSLRRDVSEDDYAGDVYLMEIDAHYSARDIFTSTGGSTGGSSDTSHFVAFNKVLGLQDSMNVANAYVDSNYVLTSETTSWDKDASNDMLASAIDDSMANYIDNTAYGATWDANTDAPTKNAVYDEMQLREPKFTTQLIGSGANYDIVGNTNIIVYHVGDENAEVNFPVDTGLPSGTVVRVKVVNIPNGYTVTLDFADKLDWNPQTSTGVNSPVLTDADNGYSAIFMLTDLGGGEIWWQQLL